MQGWLDKICCLYILYQIRTDNVDAKDRSINHYTKRTIRPFKVDKTFQSRITVQGPGFIAP